jgi:hypothetical protein
MMATNPSPETRRLASRTSRIRMALPMMPSVGRSAISAVSVS